MTRNLATHASYMRSLNTSAAAYFGIFAATLAIGAVYAASIGESMVGVVGLAAIALFSAGLTVFAAKNLREARRAHA